MGSSRTGVQNARKDECASIARGAVREDERRSDPVNRESLGGPIVASEQESRARSAKRADRGEPGTCSPEEGGSEVSSSHRQARLRRRHGPSSSGDPVGNASGSSGGGDEHGFATGSLIRDIDLSLLNRSSQPLLNRFADALLAEPRRGPRPGGLDAAAIAVPFDLDDAAAANASPAGGFAQSAHRDDGDLATVGASMGHHDRRRDISEANAGNGAVVGQTDERDSTQHIGPFKRRRIRGKQPQLWASSGGSAASAGNSVQVADSAGPWRSAHLHEDRFAVRGDRHGQVLEPSTGAIAGAGSTCGTAVGGGDLAWSTWRGRPPDAG